MISPLNDAALEVGTLLLAAPDTAARAALITSAFVDAIPDSACVLHRLASTEEDSTWFVLGVAGEISVEQTGLQDSAALIAALHHAFLALGGLTILSTLTFIVLRPGDGSKVSNQHGAREA